MTAGETGHPCKTTRSGKQLGPLPLLLVGCIKSGSLRPVHVFVVSRGHL